MVQDPYCPQRDEAVGFLSCSDRPIAQLVEHWSPKPGVGGSSPSWPAIKKVDMEKIGKFFKEAKVELDKVIFPTKVQVRQAFVAVVMVVAVISIFLALVDMLMSAIVSSTI